jgi:glycerophosphoryl diester phosphodiesterase
MASAPSGADMFEFDVRRTADDRLVVHHDECVGERRLSDLPMQEADTASRAAGYSIPTLEAVLDRARGALRLDLEVKETVRDDDRQLRAVAMTVERQPHGRSGGAGSLSGRSVSTNC